MFSLVAHPLVLEINSVGLLCSNGRHTAKGGFGAYIDDDVPVYEFITTIYLLMTSNRKLRKDQVSTISRNLNEDHYYKGLYFYIFYNSFLLSFLITVFCMYVFFVLVI